MLYHDHRSDKTKKQNKIKPKQQNPNGPSNFRRLASMVRVQNRRVKAACHYTVILKGKEMLWEDREEGSTPRESKIKRGPTVQEKGMPA